MIYMDLLQEIPWCAIYQYQEQTMQLYAAFLRHSTGHDFPALVFSFLFYLLRAEGCQCRQFGPPHRIRVLRECNNPRTKRPSVYGHFRAWAGRVRPMGRGAAGVIAGDLARGLALHDLPRHRRIWRARLSRAGSAASAGCPVPAGFNISHGLPLCPAP